MKIGRYKRSLGHFHVSHHVTENGMNWYRGYYDSKDGTVVFFYGEYNRPSRPDDYYLNMDVTINGYGHSSYTDFQPYHGDRSMMLRCAAFIRKIKKQWQN